LAADTRLDFSNPLNWVFESAIKHLRSQHEAFSHSENVRIHDPIPISKWSGKWPPFARCPDIGAIGFPAPDLHQEFFV
jgi:hypothetical protein